MQVAVIVKVDVEVFDSEVQALMEEEDDSEINRTDDLEWLADEKVFKAIDTLGKIPGIVVRDQRIIDEWMADTI